MNLMLVIAFLLAVIGKTGFMLDDESKGIIYIEDEQDKTGVKSEEISADSGNTDNLDEFIDNSSNPGSPSSKPSNKPTPAPPPPSPSFNTKDEPIKNPFDDLGEYDDLADEMLDDIFKHAK